MYLYTNWERARAKRLFSQAPYNPKPRCSSTRHTNTYNTQTWWCIKLNHPLAHPPSSMCEEERKEKSLWMFLLWMGMSFFCVWSVSLEIRTQRVEYHVLYEGGEAAPSWEEKSTFFTFSIVVGFEGVFMFFSPYHAEQRAELQQHYVLSFHVHSFVPIEIYKNENFFH